MWFPNNDVREKVVGWVGSWWAHPAIRWGSTGILFLDLFLFWQNIEALSNPIMGYLGLYAPEYLECEHQLKGFYVERNLFLTGTSIFLFLVIFRLIKIQEQLQQSRANLKALQAGSSFASTGVPVGKPVM